MLRDSSHSVVRNRVPLVSLAPTLSYRLPDKQARSTSLVTCLGLKASWKPQVPWHSQSAISRLMEKQTCVSSLRHTVCPSARNSFPFQSFLSCLLVPLHLCNSKFSSEILWKHSL